MVESCSTLPSLFVFCVFAKVSNWHFGVLCVLPFYPNVVPARESHPDVASLMSSQSHISFRRSFNFGCRTGWMFLRKTKRADYTEHQKSAGAWLSLQNDVLCNRLWKSKSGSASYSSRQQNQRRGGAVRHFRCTDTVSDEPTNYVSIWSNISIQLFMYVWIDFPRHYYTRSDCFLSTL